MGFKTIVVCVNERYLDKSFIEVIDQISSTTYLKNVDVCGENGEFHTFTYDGPIFSKPIDFEIVKSLYRKYEKPKGFLKHRL
jgi:diphthamide synthase (EF-2-diphthine--ammonia ligase)